MPHDPLRTTLRRLLGEPLPGRAAHREIWDRVLPARPLDSERPRARRAAVLLALVPGEQIHVPLIRRPGTMEHHAGQIALPGGELHPGEDPVAAALREAHEEIGLPPDAVEILGKLTPFPISVSNFVVEPIVGWVHTAPRWNPDPVEVQELLFADVDELLRVGPSELIERERGGMLLQVPAFPVGDARVWGATAFVLSELLYIWRRVRAAG